MSEVNTDATFDIIYVFGGKPDVQHGVPLRHFVCEMSRIFEACAHSVLSGVSVPASEEEIRVCRALLDDAVKRAAEYRVRAEEAEKTLTDVRAEGADTQGKLASVEGKLMIATKEARYHHEMKDWAVTRATDARARVEEAVSHRVAACQVAYKKLNDANARASYNKRMVEHAELKTEGAQAEVRTCRELLDDAVKSSAEATVRLEEANKRTDVSDRKASDSAKEADTHRTAAASAHLTADIANKRANISEREAADATRRAEEADTDRVVAEGLTWVATRDMRNAICEAERVVADAQNATRDAEMRAENADTYRFFTERLVMAVISGHKKRAEDAEGRAEDAEERVEVAEGRVEVAEGRAEDADDEEEDEVSVGCLACCFRMFD